MLTIASFFGCLLCINSTSPAVWGTVMWTESLIIPNPKFLMGELRSKPQSDVLEKHLQGVRSKNSLLPLPSLNSVALSKSLGLSELQFVTWKNRGNIRLCHFAG